MAELTIIILNWNAAGDTIRCIERINQWATLKPIIIVVDNASSDNSVGEITTAYPEVILISNPTNQGFAGGNNRGIEKALELGDAPVMLLNNDAWIAEADTRQLLASLAADQHIGFIGPLLFDGNQKDHLLSAGALDPSLHHQSHIGKIPQGEPVQTVQCIPGTVIIGRAEVFRNVGKLDEDYFFGSEVADLCMHASLRGYRSVIDTRAKSYHDLKRSSAYRGTLYTYYIIRNRFLLIRKFHRKWRFSLISFWTTYSLALATKVQLEGYPNTAKAIRIGLQDGLQGRFGNQNQRVLDMTKTQ